MTSSQRHAQGSYGSTLHSVLAVGQACSPPISTRFIHPQSYSLQNVLLVQTPGEMPIAKLCDFGYSKSLEESAPMTRVGTLQYIGGWQLTLCVGSL